LQAHLRECATSNKCGRKSREGDQKKYSKTNNLSFARDSL
jgi:hypothetical protein